MSDEMRSAGLDMDPELFRKEGHRIVDWIADYLAGGARAYPVLSPAAPGDVSGRLTADPQGTDHDAMKLLERVNAGGHVFLSHTRLDCGTVLHLAVGNLRTERSDLEACREAIEEGLPCL